MIRFDVQNRFSGEVQFMAEIDCKEDAAISCKLRLSALWAIEHDANLSRVNLRDADLRDADLSCVNLRDADLRDADLRGANLRGADLRGANLSCVNLSGANLSGANLSCVNLSGANLSGANLSGANLSGANLRGAKLAVVQTDIWDVYIQPETIRIGCQYHTAEEWFNFSDAEISEMEERALDWWKKWKAAIKATHEAI